MRQQAYRAGIQVGDSFLPSEGNELSQRVGKTGIDIWIITTHGPAIRKENSRYVAFVTRAESKQIIDFAKSVGIFPAAELAIDISDRKESVAFDAACIYLDRLALFTEHRFHGITPEPCYGRSVSRSV